MSITARGEKKDDFAALLYETAEMVRAWRRREWGSRSTRNLIAFLRWAVQHAISLVLVFCAILPALFP